jgi:hypothetical protein
MLMEDRLGRYWIVDWKTAMRLSGLEGPDDYLWNDDQITSYCWALWLVGIPVAGFIYVEIKKAIPSEPEPNKHRRLGRLYSVSKSQTFDPRLYRLTVQENDPVAYDQGLYDDYIAYLEDGGATFHHRHQIHRTVDELRACGTNIYLEAREMTYPKLALYPNPGRFHCKGFGANSGCAFWEPCLGKNRGEDYEYTLDTMFEKRTKHYWEEAKPSTDQRMESA